MKALYLFSALVLSACTAQEKSPATTDTIQATAMLQCAKDTDCKGERICDKGICSNPTSENEVQATTAQIEPKAAISPSTTSTNQNSSEYKEAYACAMESFKDSYGGGPAAYCGGNSADPSEIEEEAYKDAENDFSKK